MLQARHMRTLAVAWAGTHPDAAPEREPSRLATRPLPTLANQFQRSDSPSWPLRAGTARSSVPTSLVNDKILLVDDDPSVRESLSRALRSENYCVIPVANGWEALDLSRAGEVALVLLDLNVLSVRRLVGSPAIDGAQSPAARHNHHRPVQPA